MLFDCHSHSVNSDGFNTVDELCQRAIELALGGITVTDHANMNYYNEKKTYPSIIRSLKDTEEAAKKYEGKLRVLKGIELGEYGVAPKKAEEVLSIGGYDAILGSVHLVPKAGWSLTYNRIDFRCTMTDAEIYEYIDCYFDLLSETVDAFDFDILAHIHCPVRYITGVWGRESNIMLFEDKISEILEKIVKRKIALEVNTAYLTDQNGNYNFSLDKIVSLYKRLGGTMVTLGSDTHNTENVARNFADAVKLLKSCGFESAYYFENRRPVEYKI